MLLAGDTEFAPHSHHAGKRQEDITIPDIDIRSDAQSVGFARHDPGEQVARNLTGKSSDVLGMSQATWKEHAHA